VGCAAAPAVAAVLTDVSCIPDLPDGTPVTVADGASPDGHVVPAGCGDGFIDLAAGEQCDPGVRGVALAGCNRDCTMQCDLDAGFLWSKNNHCYELEPTPSPVLYNGAERQVCAVLPGSPHVVTFASEDEFRAVTEHIDAGWFWVGLQETTNNNDYTSLAEFEPGWSTPCTGCYAHTTDPKVGLPAGKATGTGGLYCVQASSDPAEPSWRTVPCTGPGLRVICEREPVGSQARSCDAGTCVDLLWTHGSKSYVIGLVPLSASDAEEACIDLGGRLVVLRSRDEREQLWKELAKLTAKPTSLWIGLAQQPAVATDDGGGRDASATADAAAATGPWIWDDDAGANAYVSAWAYNRPTTATTHSTRAYLMKEQPPASDDTLARNDGPMPSVLPYVCELAVDAGGPAGNGDP
jgi:hypothetical protein